MKRALISLIVAGFPACHMAIAQDILPENTASPDCTGSDCVLTYPRSFFDQYSPITALDVVRNTPGFQIDEGDQSRGFAGAAGNVLINGERPSAKSETTSDILRRLPADVVKEVQLIRGQSGGLDLRGQSVVVNVLLLDAGRSSVTYEAGAQSRSVNPGFFPFGNVSLSQSSDWYDVTVGAEVERRGTFQTENDEQVLGPDDELLEQRDENFGQEGWDWKLSLNGQARLGDYKISINTAYNDISVDDNEVSERLPVGAPTPAFLIQDGDEDREIFELGGDIERSFGSDWTAKAVGLYTRDDAVEGGSLSLGSTEEDAGLLTDSNLETLTTETIGRLEADYAGWKNHILELSGEYAVNSLRSNFTLQLADTPGGDLMNVLVAGADTRIREERGDFSLSDSWTLNKLVVDTTLAAETSTIRQTGDLENSRTFTFFKPSFAASYSPSTATQYRARVERLVGQLNFGDFASSTDLGDNELALGNADLRPDTRWRFSLASEWRFEGIGSLTLQAVHEEISDVIDVLPVGPGLEATGNIGDATRSRIESEGTLPLDAILPGGRLDFEAFIQRSRVTDPVTGGKRRLSNERWWEIATEFRQDFPRSKISWGGIFVIGSSTTFFGVDELDSTQREVDADLFIEATRFGGLRFRLELGNVFSNGQIRNRRVFSGLRTLSPLSFRERRDRDFGFRLTFSVRGTF